MSSLSDINNSGTDLIILSNPMPEPLNPPAILQSSLERFDPDIYNTSQDSHLYRLLVALIGDSGVSGLKKQHLYSRLQSGLESTFFSDLDKLYGSPLGITRLNTERYDYDPRSQALTSTQWQEIHQKDASFRNRCLKWVRAIIHGGTLSGIKLAAEAGCGIECDVIENYKYLNSQKIGNNYYPYLGKTYSQNEFIIIPQTPTLGLEEERHLITLVDQLRPANCIPTINTTSVPRIQIIPSGVISSSNYFSIQTLITGNATTLWPDTNATIGNWIVPNQQLEAPSFAFNQIQEYTNFISIQSASSSSYHIGKFNSQQQQLFINLNNLSSTTPYYPKYAYSPTASPLRVTNVWSNGYGDSTTKLLVNNYYPLNYFAISSNSITANPSNTFWASNENLKGTTETLTLDLGVSQQVNYIDFEISQKPVDISISYSNDNITWTDAVPQPAFESTTSIAYLPSDVNPWFKYELHMGVSINQQFNNVFQARYIRVTFTRREDMVLPTDNTPFPYSIEIRNARIAHIVGYVDDILNDNNNNYVPDFGTDILGNNYVSQLTVSSGTNCIDNLVTTYWQSQPNPTPFGVERLYFEFTAVSGTIPTITEIYLDPLTMNNTFHIYYSNDDTFIDPDEESTEQFDEGSDIETSEKWDNKLWIPINEHYKTKKGYIYLPSPLQAKYLKFEFSNLTAFPYNSLEYPTLPPVTYDKFPSWIQNLFNTLYPTTLDSDNLLYPFTQISIDPLSLGYMIQPDSLSSGKITMPTPTMGSTQQQNNQFASLVTSASTSSTNKTNRQQLESQIQFRSSFMYQQDLLSQLDTTGALARFVKMDQTTLLPSESINVEAAVPPSPDPIAQSSTDLTESEQELKTPIMWFPYTARHGYQRLQISRPTKIAYFVGIKEISFWRRDYTQLWNDPYYSETFSDTYNISSNDFIQNDWMFMPTFSSPTLSVPVLSNNRLEADFIDLFENFDEPNGSLF